MVANENRSRHLSAVPSSRSLSAAEIELQIRQKEHELEGLAQRSAPASWQYELARELVALRGLLLVAEGGTKEVTRLGVSTIEAMTHVGVVGQIQIDGMRGKVDESVIAKVEEVRQTSLEALDLINATGAAALLERVRGFKGWDSRVGKRDLVVGYLTNKVPSRLDRGGQ